MPLKFNNDDNLNVARGLIRATSIRNIFGHNDLVSGDWIPAWELTIPYTYPSSNLVMGVVSNDISDTSVDILILGLDSNYEEIQETVSLNGTTEVFTTTPFFRINDVVTVSGNANGAIVVANTGTTYGQITSGEGRNQASIYTVPAGCDFFLYRIDAYTSDAGAAKAAEFRNFVTLPNGVNLRVAKTTFLNNMSVNRVFPFKYTEKTDIQLQVRSISGTHPMSIFAEGIVIDKEDNGLR